MTPGLTRYVDVASRFQARDTATTPAWLQRVRQEGLAHFARLGLPTTRDEAWKYTNLAPIADGAFVPSATAGSTAELAAVVARLALPGPRLVFVDGRLSPELSSVAGLPRGLTLKPLRDALVEDGAFLEAELGQRALAAEHAFTALNAALLEDGAVLRLAPGALSEVPVQLVFLTRGDAPVLASPRILVVAGEGSEATLVETYASATGGGSGQGFTNAVTEVTLGDNASLKHYRLQAEGDAAVHVGGLHVRQGRDSRFVSHTFAFGGVLARNEVHVTFAGEGGDATLNGLYVGRGTQHLDQRTALDHAVPRCTSRELYKGVLDDRARGTFHGLVKVRQDAQRTDSRQQNRNLLLSEHAQADTRPQLEILADDVKCAHGAVVGRLDAQALFYLRSRGIPRAEAERLLTYAFARELVDAVPEGPVRASVEGLLAPKLPGAPRTEVTA
ncbi:Fe-S cluster assembly protein SufD [Myxococcus llanfairpwllgwyngyllgogerychwyrndrobwllllantysiliogogogochensis]|uniref:Fe-S cluster assembly protein SufD n=1 Tax=Myxococcus llanfairpwllgwyngyllgogerychwyrndrobwllllantysiliogogogochensis TaxID=2590453 RepID=A0A540WXV5_9BACT|nr:MULTISPECIES: Fe-S cluster assembly protein SufD [Myxococcus]NTX09223.1 Fe-S cluster assembly protein SufD [Myxococcus sp. CA056]NTX39744.1 Fe-S cluster assembly protein SufD [Myxococcus sp. CA033]TQF13839.1 Fe-S cluster assembly protein SufD [Myxococcus llanfairpwllgwyngyllgogerychwyrndrobwllllantysiliogogogochensis]